MNGHHDPCHNHEIATGSFLGLDSWGGVDLRVGSGLVGLESANAQNSYCELLGGYQETNPGGVVRKLGGYNPLRGCRKLPGLLSMT